MSYKVLSRKYRPKIFNEVVGQDNVLTILKSFIESESIPHALIFCGSRGVGKTSLARIFAKTINCNKLNNNINCSNCTICSEIDNNKSLDVIEIDAASNNGVDQIREVIESSNYASINCKYKVFIIDEVHMLSKAAFNALLKTLEEPNENTIFILATTEVEKIPSTILSRCQIINFKIIPKTQLINNLQDICAKEGISIDEESLISIAEESNGSARDSLGILEQLMSSLNKNIDIQNTRNILGITSNQILFQISNCLIRNDIKGSLKYYDSIYQNGYDSKKFIHSLLNYFRSTIYYKLGIENDVEDIQIMDESQVNELKKYDIELLENIFDELIKLYEQCNNTENIKFLIESNLIKLCLISNYLNFNEIVDDTIPDDINPQEETINISNDQSEEGIKIKPEKKSPKLNKKKFDETKFLKSLKDLKDENYKLINGSKFIIEDTSVKIIPKNSMIYEILNENEKIIRLKELIKELFESDYKIEIMKDNSDNTKNGNDDFKLSEKKDKLFESETIKNLFSTFDCRVLDIEKDN